MPLSLTDMATAFADGQMLNLVTTAIRYKAALVVGESAPSASRLAWAQKALADPTPESGAIWAYMIGANAAADMDAVLRSVGNAATPSDTTISNNVAIAVDKLYP